MLSRFLDALVENLALLDNALLVGYPAQDGRGAIPVGLFVVEVRRHSGLEVVSKISFQREMGTDNRV